MSTLQLNKFGEFPLHIADNGDGVMPAVNQRMVQEGLYSQRAAFLDSSAYGKPFILLYSMDSVSYTHLFISSGN